MQECQRRGMQLRWATVQLRHVGLAVATGMFLLNRVHKFETGHDKIMNFFSMKLAFSSETRLDEPGSSFSPTSLATTCLRRVANIVSSLLQTSHGLSMFWLGIALETTELPVANWVEPIVQKAFVNMAFGFWEGWSQLEGTSPRLWKHRSTMPGCCCLAGLCKDAKLRLSNLWNLTGLIDHEPFSFRVNQHFKN